MSKSIVSELASQWFGEYLPLVYWIARRGCERALVRRGADYSANDIDELAQDAVCRAYARFLQRCQREVCGESDRREWACQCAARGVRDALRSKSTFGSISSPVAVRDDALNRGSRVASGLVHGDDDEREAALEQIQAAPVVYTVQRWELEQLIERELPAHLHATAIYAACGLTQEQSAILQGVTDRTVRARLREIRALLCPQTDIYAVIIAALKSCLAKPRRQARLFDRIAV